VTPAEPYDDYRRRLPGAVWPPPGYEPPPCELELFTEARLVGAEHEVTASVRNRSERAITFELPDRCPEGPVAFAGLPPGYDYYSACRRGASAGPRPPRRLVIAPGETRELTRIRIAPAGNACAAPLAAGRHNVGFLLPASLRSCNVRFAEIPGSLPPEPVPPLPDVQPFPSCPPGYTC
jgi:hypothetical protein